MFFYLQVVDPLGTIIAQCSDEPGFVLAPIDLTLINNMRETMPLKNHRRYDIYPKLSSNGFYSLPITDSNEIKFGSVVVKGFQIFCQTTLSMAFTNIKCVLPGRILYFLPNYN